MLAILAAMLVSVLLAVGVERVAYRPLRNSPTLVPLISAIGASLFLQYSFRGFFGSGHLRLSDAVASWSSRRPSRS